MAEAVLESSNTTLDKPHLVVEIAKDLRSNAVVQVIGHPHRTRKASQSSYTCRQASGVLAVIGVSILQMLMAWATVSYVKNGMILSKKNPILTSYEMFVGTNLTINNRLDTHLCGDWQNQDFYPGSNGSLSQITMPDGSVYRPNRDYPLFYNLKVPFRTFDYAYLGPEERSIMDDTLYVLHEGLTLSPFNGAGYSTLFIVMLSMWLFAILAEFRRLTQNFCLLILFKNDMDTEESFKKDVGKFKLVNINTSARVVLVINMVTRALVMAALLPTGCFLIMYTTSKIDLILNSLALLFVLELDDIIFFATVSAPDQVFIDDIDELVLEVPKGTFIHGVMSLSSYLMPLLPIVLIFAAAFLLRWHQLQIFQVYFRLTAAMCLFAGKTPGAEPGLVAPVTGFCDSLLGAACAPDVTPNSTLLEHGPCVITDQRVGHIGTQFFYLNDAHLFKGRYDESGNARSWVLWGKGLSKLYEKQIWNQGPYQDLLRKNCLQMYQKRGVPENRLVELYGETRSGAPFYCERDALWKAMFGKFTEGRLAADEITMENIEQVAALDDPAVVAAIDLCGTTTRDVPSHYSFDYGSRFSANAEVLENKEASLLAKHKDHHHAGKSVSDHTRQMLPESPEWAKGRKQRKLGPAGILTIDRPHGQKLVNAESQLSLADISPAGEVVPEHSN